LELGRPPGLVAAFLFSLLVVALLLAALFDVVLFPFSALLVVALLLAALLVVALLLAALLLVALFFASCFGVWFFKGVPAVCHCDPPLYLAIRIHTSRAISATPGVVPNRAREHAVSTI
jgi:hypothetical protein